MNLKLRLTKEEMLMKMTGKILLATLALGFSFILSAYESLGKRPNGKVVSLRVEEAKEGRERFHRRW